MCGTIEMVSSYMNPGKYKAFLHIVWVIFLVFDILLWVGRNEIPELML